MSSGEDFENEVPNYRNYEVQMDEFVDRNRNGTRVVYSSSCLYDAACYVGAYVREFMFQNFIEVIDTETGDRWSPGDLRKGHFMDDLGDLEGWVSEQPSIAATQNRVWQEQAEIWNHSSLIKPKYRTPAKAGFVETVGEKP